jgi:hypothetical protein
MSENPESSRSNYLIDLPSRFDRLEPLVEIIATVLLAFATLATAWSGYQSARWGGVQATNYSQAGALRTESTRASTQAGQLTQIDVGLFTNWINAYAADDQRLVEFYQERFRDEFVPAFEAWIALEPVKNPESPKSPFAMPEYKVELQEEAERLETEAEKKFQAGTEANQIGDNYVLNTVFLASVLFLAGIQSRVKTIPMRFLLDLLALAILSYGLYNIITLPIE